MPNVMVSGTAKKAAAGKERFPVDFGDAPALIALALPQLVDGALPDPLTDPLIASYTVTGGGLTVTSVQLDYPYQLSAVFAGGTAGTTYDAVFTITVDDADGTIITCTAPIEVV